MLREAAAEFLGTFILIVFGVGVVAQRVLSEDANGSYLAINLGWGLAVMLGVYAAAGVSGAHLNPAVSVAMAVRRGFPWPKVPAYIAAQIAGAFVASAVVFLTYREAFAAFDGGVRQVQGPAGTAGIFATYPQPFLSIIGGSGRSDCRHRAADGWRARAQRSTQGMDRRPGCCRRSSAPWWWPSAWRSASTPATRSTRRGISGRACSPRWRVGVAPCSRPATAGGGCPSSARRSARVIGAVFYDGCLGRFLPAGGVER